MSAQAKVNIFACEPEWKSLVDEIGKEKVKSFSATFASQDPHHIRAKPSLIAKIRNADLLICSGADLEVGWLPLLLKQGSANIWHGEIGNLMVSDIVTLIEKPTKELDRSHGDVHAQGNPHSHLNPYNILIVAKEINNRLQKIDSDNSKIYQRNYENFVKRWKKSIKSWERKASRLKNVNILVHHKSFSYLIEWLKMKEVATLEVKPGIPPTARHLQNLLDIVKEKPVKFVIRAPYDEKRASQWIADKISIKEITLPFTVGGDEESGDLFMLFERTIDLMIQSL